MFKFTTLLLPFMSLALTGALECPPDATLYPCACYGGSMLRCPIFTQSTSAQDVYDALDAMRTTNGVAANETFNLPSLVITWADMPSLDLSRFFNMKLTTVDIVDNLPLQSIAPNTNVTFNEGQTWRIEAQNLILYKNRITRAGFGDTLKWFAPTLQKLDLTQNYRIESPVDTSEEILPGLSLHPQLTHLSISGNKLTWLEGGQFRTLVNLVELDVGDNTIERIGDDAFLFDKNEAMKDTLLYIWMGFNSNLNETGWSNKTGIDTIGRPVTIRASYSNHQSLPQHIFEPFLDAHGQNVLDVIGNPIQCDERVRWLKNRREEFESRVKDADCANDDGFTVFTSSLVDLD